MSESNAKGRRYPSKLSIIAITDEMRAEIDAILKEDVDLTEAAFVRSAIRDAIAKLKKAKEGDK